MKAQKFELLKYEAEDGKVFDWKNLSAHTFEDENGNTVQEHLYAQTIFLGVNDNIENYIEVDKP